MCYISSACVANPLALSPHALPSLLTCPPAGASKPGEGVSSGASVVGDATQVAEGALRSWCRSWGSCADEKALKEVLADGWVGVGGGGWGVTEGASVT
jgi:hypothetical protein